MTKAAILSDDWLASHPLPNIEEETDKNERGRVLVVGGSRFVPGALRLTGEAALRAGAGKLQIATVKAVALPLGVLVPEAAVIALPSDKHGEINRKAAKILKPYVEKADALILGPGMRTTGKTEELVKCVLSDAHPSLTIVLDAGALTCAATLTAEIAAFGGRVVMTPHWGEFATLTGMEETRIAADAGRAALDAAVRFGAVVALKGPTTYLALPDGELCAFEGQCPALATSGSGDVLAGIIGGLLARGAKPGTAAGWGIWLHNRAGRRLTESPGQSFLAREIVDHIGATEAN